MEEGKVKWFNLKKGFGFIEEANGKDIFVHHSGVDEMEPLKEGQLVSYEVSEGKKGPCAIKVKAV